MSAVIVLGMHFSGTSCLAEALVHAGVEFGAHLRRGSDYPTYEDDRIARLHVGLVPWDNPRVFVPTPAAQEKCESIVASYEGRDFGFKEPSSMFFTSLWENAVRYPRAKLSAPAMAVLNSAPMRRPSGTVRYVGSFRHPGPVLGHIKAAWGKTSVPADELWQRYAQRLLDLHRRSPFPLVCFDEDDDTYKASLARLIGRVCGPDAEVRFNPACRDSYPHEPASPEALALYEELKAAAAQ